jgi:hypothetical protein
MPPAGEPASNPAASVKPEDFRPETFKPAGTFALLSAVGLFMLIGWLFLYFAVFLPRGFIH